MVLKLFYEAGALTDLEAIFEWSLTKHPETTEQFGEELIRRLELLRSFPYIGVSISRPQGVRRLVHAPLAIYYRVDERRGAIWILHVRHISRKPPKF